MSCCFLLIVLFAPKRFPCPHLIYRKRPFFACPGMSNKFDGILQEFPYIGLDRFNTPASVFLLTHCHADHLSGITNKCFAGIVYCSHETRLLLSLDSRFKASLNLVVGVPFNERTRLETPHDASCAVYITLIEAYHCLGACMFLIEEVEESASLNQNDSSLNYPCGQVRRAVLCTGDVRAERWWIEDIRLSPALFPYTSGENLLNSIYFDSTFAYRGEPYIEIPPNLHGVHAAVSMLREYPKNDPEIEFEFCDTTLGFEQAWAFVLSYFGGVLRIGDHRLEKKMLLVAKHDRINGSIIGRAMAKSSPPKRGPVFHGGAASKTSLMIVRIKQCINFNIKDYTGICCPIPLDSLPPDADLQLMRVTELGTKLYCFLDRHWILPPQKSELLPLEVKLPFSRHSSFTEVKELLSIFNPHEVFPCFYSQEAWLTGFNMARLFGDICSSPEFNYDNLMARKYGLLQKDIRDRPIATVNRWNIEECDREQELIKDLLQHAQEQSEKAFLDKPALLSLRRVARVPFMETERTPEDVDFLKRGRKDFCLQRIVAGRKNKNYQDFIREQQMFYYKKHHTSQYLNGIHSSGSNLDFNLAIGGSSDYDTDSHGSSFDILEWTRKPTLDSRNQWETSFIRKPQQGLFWKVHKYRNRKKIINQSPVSQKPLDSLEMRGLYENLS